LPDCAYKELAGLWAAVFGEKPPVVADPGLTARILVAHLPPTEPYRFDNEADDAPP
jgi:hypothetical protein